MTANRALSAQPASSARSHACSIATGEMSMPRTLRAPPPASSYAELLLPTAVLQDGRSGTTATLRLVEELAAAGHGVEPSDPLRVSSANARS
jgi:hypothetical protein